MNTWFKLAWKEFWLPFFCWRKEGSPGGRDFIWLTVMLSLILTLSLLLIGSQEGVLNRFVDVLLGKMPGHGVPVWVTTNIYREGGIVQIDSKTLHEIRKRGYEVGPYREIEQNDTHIGFPGYENNIWKKMGKKSPGFTGWAVYKEDPLWEGSLSDKNLPLEIIINKTLFKKYFNYSLYRDTLKKYLPEDKWKELPEKITEHTPDTLNLDIIWLRLNSDIVPLTIRWVDRIPTVEKIAFLFPLSTYHALSFAHRYGLRYFPESFGEEGGRIKQIYIEGDEEDDNIVKFTNTINGKMVSSRGEIKFTFDKFLTKTSMEGYAKQFNLTYHVSDFVMANNVLEKDSKLIINCTAIPDKFKNEKDTPACFSDKNNFDSIDVTVHGNGFTGALVYVPDRTLLFQAKEELLKIRDGCLLIPQFYQDALNRFGFLSKMIEAMGKPYGSILGLFLGTLLGIQIVTLIGHRRHRYGMFLSKGIIWWQIYFMLFLQTLISLVIGIAVAVFTITIARFTLQYAIAPVALEYKETLKIVDLNLLPITFNMYGSIIIGVLFLTWLLTALILYSMPLRKRTHPAALFQG